MPKTDEEINSNNTETDSNEDIVYKQTEKELENNTSELVKNQGESNFGKNEKVVYVPQNAIQTAHNLLINSETVSHLPEIDNEIKLTKLNGLQSYICLQHMEILEQISWLKENQEIKMLENQYYMKSNNPQEDFIEAIYTQLRTQNNKSDQFDALGSLRKIFDIAVLGRAEGGFERTKQVETISNTNQTIEDKTTSKPGWLPRFSGGAK